LLIETPTGTLRCRSKMGEFRDVLLVWRTDSGYFLIL
jgi:hypothetical protein